MKKDQVLHDIEALAKAYYRYTLHDPNNFTSWNELDDKTKDVLMDLAAGWLDDMEWMPSVDQYQVEIGEWGNFTFPKATPRTISSHILEEVLELYGVPREHHATVFTIVRLLATSSPANDEEEAADVFLLLLHYAYKRGFSLFTAAEAKMEVNRNRFYNKDTGTYFKHQNNSAVDNLVAVFSRKDDNVNLGRVWLNLREAVGSEVAMKIWHEATEIWEVRKNESL